MNTAPLHSPLHALLIDRPLRDIFWLYGVLPSNLLWAASLAVYFSAAPLASVLLMFSLLLAYTVWIICEIWHCSGNVKNPLHGDIARLLTAAWAINTLLLVAFLLLQRLG
ncbi:hypothetical protein [Pseudomonas sp. N040]|uniref:hypothetical protein n=1 Tax=Pseudomonas sp. N040 TaxID=2785325 RepID=UPI0018A27CAE|nr:hypothetical protein [Pseudomonas sp. N040]MBF7728777.1 hypothetical protein [Pseudomonas sp. N040]MBW7012417.1 hypothetical protein [Pseudomonas sp. N040]